MIFGFYLENLEYYTNLRKFSLAVDSLNKHREKKISFKMKAFEQVGGINADRVASLSEMEHELWFVNERDSVTAGRVINYIDSNPNEQILIFYGSAHLNDSKFSKRMGGIEKLTDEESMGYFLAYYLEQAFGIENVLKIMPWGSNLYKVAQKQVFPYPGHRSFIAKPKDLGVPDSLAPGSDYIYNIQFDFLPLIEGLRVCSKLALSNNIECIKYVLPFVRHMQLI